MKIPSKLKKEFEELELNKGIYLLAFSGGPDSVYLLEALKSYLGDELSDIIRLCYINYHDSPAVKEEEAIVNEYVEKYHLKLYRFDTKFKKGNFEDWARKYRYQKFKTIIRKEKMTALLTAHQKDDDIETYILQKERKNCPLHYGLNKITILNGIKLIRPLLNISKAEIYNTLNKEYITYYEDITNHDDHTKRNVIRKNLNDIDRKQLLIDKTIENKDLEHLYQSFNDQKAPYQFDFYNALTEENKKRFVFYLIDKYLKTKKRREGIAKEIFEFLKSNSNNSLAIKKDLFLYRTKSSFFFFKDFSMITYSFTYHQKKIYKNKYFTIDLTDISKFNLVSLPVTIRNAEKDDLIDTDLPTKNVYAFLKKQQVPAFLYPAYPVFLVNNKIKCVPFYKDIKEKKIPLELFLLF